MTDNVIDWLTSHFPLKYSRCILGIKFQPICNSCALWTCFLTPSLTSISAHNMPGEIRLFWFYYGVTYNFIHNHNHCRDLHQFFFCLFETFVTISEIMFASDSMSKKYFFNSSKYMNVYFVYNIIVCFVCFVALHPKSTAMVMAGRSVHLTTLFPGQAWTSS